MPPFEIFVRFGVKGGKVISIKERGLTKVAAVCRPKFVPSLSKFKGKHFIRRRAKNQLTQQKETLKLAFRLLINQNSLFLLLCSGFLVVS